LSLKILEPENAPGAAAAGAAGLTTAVAVERLRAEGPNAIEDHGRRSWSSSPFAPDGARSGAVARAAHSLQTHWLR
jgi:hypothetical protein